MGGGGCSVSLGSKRPRRWHRSQITARSRPRCRHETGRAQVELLKIQGWRAEALA